MVRSLLFTIAMLLCSFGVALSQSTVLQGKVTDAKEPLIGASVKASKGTDFVRGAITDMDGAFRLSLDPGTYDIEITYTGFQTQRVSWSTGVDREAQ